MKILVIDNNLFMLFSIFYLIGCDNGNDNLPTEFVLYQNYPNPFGGVIPTGNPGTTIKYSIPSSKTPLLRQGTQVGGVGGELVILKVYDILGLEVATLIDKQQQPSNYKTTFNANGLPSGVYYYSIKTNDFYKTKKMILIR